MTIIKTCGNCKLKKKLTEFHKNCESKDGYTSQCKDCRSAKKKIYCEANKEKIATKNHEWYEATKPARAEYQRKYIQANKQRVAARNKIYMKEWRKANNKLLAASYKIWYENNEEPRKKYMKIYSKKWQNDNKDLVNARNSKHRANKINATPSWVDKEAIKEIYREAQHLTEETGQLYHVDHIVPLKGKYICGLHCENNLQVITAKENLAKSNKLE